MEPLKRFIYAYDFDGTLTSSDSLLAFIRYAKGDLRFWLGMLWFSPLFVLMKLGHYSNSRVKEKVLTLFFRGTRIEDFNERCRQFAASHQHIFRPKGIEDLKGHLAKVAASRLPEDGVFVVSASPSNWVKPFFSDLGLTAEEMRRLRFLCTEMEVVEGRVTGKFSTPNCYGPEKVRRLKEQLRLTRSLYIITAYGDSRGDKELLDFADVSHFKPFRE
jgi:HAD superfamily phosphoserine phosphatase-like hydrolase